MYCKYCGKQVSDTSSFCKYCGGDIRKIEITETDYHIKGNNLIDNTEELEFEKYVESMVKRKIVGVIFRVLFWLSAIYFMVISCLYSYALGEILIMILKIIFFPFTIVIWPLIGLIFGELAGWVFWIWFFMMGSYAISTFYGKLRPIG